MMTDSSAVTCSRCKNPLSRESLNTSDLFRCPACGAELLAMAFPALVKPAERGGSGELLLDDSEAGCFYHPRKKAAGVCAHCGRFLCGLCDVEFDGRHLCPACIESGGKKGRIKSLDHGRLLYDDVAMAMAIFPMILIWPTLLTAPIALYIAIRYWRAPSSVVARSKLRMILAMLLAGLQILGWGTLCLLAIFR